ncbi:MAG TPA: DeoR/GlpR family DNA-binding transcription regulator [Magnetospirillaceae bacterium]|nr:DeoR/GlpR family DNA-binding transcription regulator [Magnetospirillaceae bacterium]
MPDEAEPGPDRLRHRRILDLLAVRRDATVDELTDFLEVSPATVRRDMAELARLGLVKRLRGGLVLMTPLAREPSFSQREITRSAEKAAVGRAAAEFVRDNDVVFLDGGTTMELLVPALAERSGLTVLTCGINVAARMTRYPSLRGIMLGGEIHADSQTIIGTLAEVLLNVYGLRCDVAFIAAAGVSARGGATNRMIDRIPLKRRAMGMAEKSVLVADGSKLGVEAFARIADIGDFAAVVTDASAPTSELEALRALGVEVVVALSGTEPAR